MKRLGTLGFRFLTDSRNRTMSMQCISEDPEVIALGIRENRLAKFSRVQKL